MHHLSATKERLENLMRRGRSFGARLVVVAYVAIAAFVFVLRLLFRIASRRFGHII